MNVGYVLFSGACLVIGLAFQYGDLGVDDHEIDRGETRSSYSTAIGDDWEERQAANSSYLKSLSEGAQLAKVIGSLGEPDFSQAFDNHVKLLMYRTRSVKTDLQTTQDETAVLVFREGELIGMKDSSDWYGGARVRANTSTYSIEEAENNRLIGELVVGESRTSVIGKLGRPDFIDYPAENLEILSYRTHSESLDGYTSRDEATSLLFDGGELLAKTRWGTEPEPG